MAFSFPETRWTLIQRVRTDSDPSEALEEWCRQYWPPVFSYICAQGRDSEEARELAQSFFERLFKNGPERVLPGQVSGSFRAYLMRSVKNYLTDQWRAQQSIRRGGGVFEVSTEELDGLSDPSCNPQQVFDQSWALTIMDLAILELEKEMEAKGKGDFFEVGKKLLDGRGVTDEDRSALAKELGMKDGAFRVALHRLRGRYRQLIEDQVRETVSSEEEFQEELCYLCNVWS